MKRRMIALLLTGVLVFGGCSNTVSNKAEGSSENSNNTSNLVSTESNDLENSTISDSTNIVDGDITFVSDSSEMFTDRDYEVGYDESRSINIQLNGDSISCDSDAVQINGTTVILLEEETYIISGTLDDGMIVVNVGKKDKPQIVLNGVTINSKTSAPIYVLEGDKIFITLADGTTNTLTNGGSFEAIDDNNIDSVIYSKQDLTLNGSGSLVVESPAGHGIVSKDDLVITSGMYTITSASKGLSANDSIRIANANITIASGKDGMQAENTDDASLGFIYIASGNLNISAEGDGISAGAYMQIEGGVFDIVSGGGSKNAVNSTSNSWGMMGGGKGGIGSKPGHSGLSSSNFSSNTSSTSSSSNSSDGRVSMKALKATLDILISAGTFILDSADDSIHSNTNIIINGGTFEIASGDDGFHADDTLRIHAGTIHITESYEGLEGLHVEVVGGDITIISSDDGINAAGGNDSSGTGGFRGGDMFGGGKGNSSSNASIVISGGSIYVNASGDGIDANGTLEISGGYTVVCGPTIGDTSVLDYDISGVITGGTFIGTGAYMMAQTFSSSSQGVVAVSVGNQSAGTEITLEDSKGNIVVHCEPKLSYQIVILSTPDMVSGEEYTITVGSATGTFEAN